MNSFNNINLIKPDKLRIGLEYGVNTKFDYMQIFKCLKNITNLELVRITEFRAYKLGFKNTPIFIFLKPKIQLQQCAKNSLAMLNWAKWIKSFGLLEINPRTLILNQWDYWIK